MKHVRDRNSISHYSGLTATYSGLTATYINVKLRPHIKRSNLHIQDVIKQQLTFITVKEFQICNNNGQQKSIPNIPDFKISNQR